MKRLKLKKENEYLAYISEHIGNVKHVWSDMQMKLHGNYAITEDQWKAINKRVEDHDRSKTNVIEFDAYRKRFYPTYDAEKDEREFNYAWLRHIRKNDHHWNHWVLVNGVDDIKALEMPFTAIFEMLLDWKAMSIKFGDTPVEYYAMKKDSMILHKKTIEMLETLLEIF